MVPWYQIAAHAVAAAALLLGIVYAPMLLRRRLPHWLQAMMLVIASALVVAIIYAATAGHWPMRA